MKLPAIFVMTVALISVSSYAADPDPVTDFDSGLATFTFRNIFENGDVTNDSGGVRAATTPDKFPAMQSQGITIVRFKMVPCGSNLPHTHPRATEMLTLLSGGPLQVGFIDTKALNSQNPGTLTSSEALFKIPLRTVATAFNLDVNKIKKINSTLHPYGPGLKKTSTSGCVPGKHITTNF
eukprot:Gb_25216 [translate_table: standard]